MSLCYLASDSFVMSFHVGTSSDLTSTGASVSGWLPLSSAGESPDTTASINLIFAFTKRQALFYKTTLFSTLT